MKLLVALLVVLATANTSLAGGTGDRCNEFAPTLRASALFLGRPLLADSWLRAVNASGLGNTTISYTAFLSVQWALNPDSCSVMAYNRTFRSYKPVTEPRAVANTTACCQLCKDNALCSVWLYNNTNQSCVLANQASVYTLIPADSIMTGFVGNSLDPALALYHTVPGLYCPVDLVQAGELNTMLGNVTDTYLPIYIGGSSNNNGLITVSGMSSGSNSALNISGHGLIVRSVRACNSIFHIMAGDFFYEDLPPQVTEQMKTMNIIKAISDVAYADGSVQAKCSDVQLLDVSRATQNGTATILDTIVTTALSTINQQAPMCMENDLNCADGDGGNDSFTPAAPGAPWVTPVGYDQAVKGGGGNQTSSSGDGSNTAVLAVAIAVPVAVVLGVSLAVGLFMMHRRRRRRRPLSDPLDASFTTLDSSHNPGGDGPRGDSQSSAIPSSGEHWLMPTKAQSEGALGQQAPPPKPPGGAFGREPLLTTAQSAPLGLGPWHKTLPNVSAVSLDAALHAADAAIHAASTSGAPSDSDGASEQQLTGALGNYVVHRSASGVGVGLTAAYGVVGGLSVVQLGDVDTGDASMAPCMPAPGGMGGEKAAKLSHMTSSHTQFLLDHDVLEYDRRIGQGSYGTVYLGQWNGVPVAIKTLNMNLEGNGGEETQQLMRGIRAFEKELMLLSSIRHPKIVMFLGATLSPPCLIMEYCRYGSLYSLLRRVRCGDESIPPFTWHRKLSMIHDAVQGMLFLHSKGTIHADLKSPNLLVDSSWTVKVTDFGLAALPAQETHMTQSIMTNPRWTAPEVLDGQRPSYAADVYALGIIMYEVLSLLEPFGDLTSVQVITRVLINKQRPPIPGAEDSEYENPGADRYVTLMQRCWHIDPQERPSMEEIDQEFRKIRNIARAAKINKAACTGPLTAPLHDSTPNGNTNAPSSVGKPPPPLRNSSSLPRSEVSATTSDALDMCTRSSSATASGDVQPLVHPPGTHPGADASTAPRDAASDVTSTQERPPPTVASRASATLPPSPFSRIAEGGVLEEVDGEGEEPVCSTLLASPCPPSGNVEMVDDGPSSNHPHDTHMPMQHMSATPPASPFLSVAMTGNLEVDDDDDAPSITHIKGDKGGMAASSLPASPFLAAAESGELPR